MDTKVLDWDQPLEAVHVDGRVCPAKQFRKGEVWPDSSGQYHVAVDEGKEYETLTFAEPDGSPWQSMPWTIRNVAPKEVEWGAAIPVEAKRPEWLKDDDQIMIMSQYGVQPNWNSYRSGYDGVPWGTTTFIKLKANHPHYTTPTRTALEQRMEDCLKALAVWHKCRDGHKVQPTLDTIGKEARSILADLEPVDGDFLIAREIVASARNGGLQKQSIIDGKWMEDECELVVEGIRRGRALERGE